ncbi:MAG: PCRF domain-containing protein [Candidatus Riflebacteria bacterium]|nr:PCRF domain-containing protein [Candidatus Riflebacteria bacterium]
MDPHGGPSGLVRRLPRPEPGRRGRGGAAPPVAHRGDGSDLAHRLGLQLAGLRPQHEVLHAKLEEILLAGSEDFDSIIMEIRAGTGGDEAALFAGGPQGRARARTEAGREGLRNGRSGLECWTWSPRPGELQRHRPPTYTVLAM